MKRGLIIATVAIAIAILAVGGYAIFHKPKSPQGSSSNTSKTSTTAINNAVLITKSNSSLGQYLAEPNGQALYTYGADSNGVSNCTDTCLASWPAYIDKGSTTNLPTGVSTIKRTDNNEVQFTYNGLPLYTFLADSRGQVTGDGMSNFKVAKPISSSSNSSNNSNGY